MADKRKYLERYLYNKIVRRTKTIEDDDGSVHVLSKNESSKLKRIHKSRIFYAALAGAVGVIILYLPKYIMGEDFFPTIDVWVPLYADYFTLEWGFLTYSLVLVILEIALLTFNNVHAVKDVAHACNYPYPDDPFFEVNMNSLIAVGLERNIKAQQEIGINPFSGLSKFQVLFFTVINLAKAAVTNLIFKLLIKRILGRYALKIMVDLAGVPVYAFWNAYAVNFVIREARVRIMATPIIKEFAEQIYEEQKDNETFRRELYYMLDFVAITKRKFHANHYLLAYVLLDKFGVELEPEHSYDDEFMDRMLEADELTIDGFSKVNLMGLALDGTISKKEQLKIYNWKKRGIYKFDLDFTKQVAEEFFTGQGTISIFTKKDEIKS